MVQFLLDNQEADFYSASDLTPRLTIQYFNINNFEKTGTYSLPIKLPKTSNNLQIIKFFGELQEDNINFITTLQAKIINKSLTLFTGTFFIESVDEFDINGYVLGNNIDWSVNFDVSLRQIESFTRYNFIGTKNTWSIMPSNPLIVQDGITNSWVNNKDNDIQWPLVSYGNYNIPEAVQLFSVSITSPGTGLSDGTHFINVSRADFILGSPAVTGYYPQVELTVLSGSIISAIVNKKGLIFDYDQSNNLFNIPAGGQLLISLFPIDQLNSISYPLEFEDIAPSPSLYKTLIRMFEDQNLNLEIQLDTNDLTEFKKLVIPFVGDDAPGWNWGQLGLMKILNTGFGPLNYIDTGPNRIVGGVEYHNLDNLMLNTIFDYAFDIFQINVNGDKFYSVPTDGIYTLRAILDIASISLDGSLNTGLPLNRTFKYFIAKTKVDSITNLFNGNAGIGLYDNTFTFTDENVLVDTDVFIDVIDVPIFQTPTTTFYQLDVTVELQKDDLIFVGYAVVNNARANKEIRIASDINSFEVTAIEDDIQLNPARFLPDITQGDLISNVGKMFNIYFTQIDNRVIMSPFKTYFLPNETAVDWTNKLDDRTFERKLANDIKQFEFKYAREDNDWSNPDYTKIDFIYTSTNKIKSGLETVELIFAPTFDRTYINENTGITTNDTLQIPTISTSDIINQLNHGGLFSYGFIPRFLSVESLEPKKWRLVTDTFFQHTLINNYVYATWNNANKNYRWADATTSGLVSTYWLENIQQIDKTYLYSTLAMLDIFDINTLDTRKPILIKNNMYILNNVENYDPIIPRPTKITFYKK